jgi:hypothetical protein
MCESPIISWTPVFSPRKAKATSGATVQALATRGNNSCRLPFDADLRKMRSRMKLAGPRPLQLL